jgi:hypothetical protein
VADPVEAALYDLGREVAWLAYKLRRHRMTDSEMAVHDSGLALEARSAEAQHRMADSRRRAEEVIAWRSTE